MDRLTIKQEKFAQGLFAGLSQREAYRQAFNCERMLDKTVDENACRLANNSKVIARINELTEELKQKNMVTVQRVVDELAHIAFDDIKNYLSFKTVLTKIGVDKETKEDIIDYKTVVELKDSDTIDTRNIAEISTGPNGQFKFKQYCKDNALIQLGKHLGMFTERVEAINHNLNQDVSNLSDDELDKELERLRK